VCESDWSAYVDRDIVGEFVVFVSCRVAVPKIFKCGSFIIWDFTSI
jgi:hypothetical protein